MATEQGLEALGAQRGDNEFGISLLKFISYLISFREVDFSSENLNSSFVDCPDFQLVDAGSILN